MDNKINFTGAFLVKNPPKAAKQQLELLSGKHKQIFENFNNTTDVFYVVRKGKDAGIAKFIYDNNLRFKFFSGLHTKSGLDTMYPEKAVETVKSQQYYISQKDILAAKFDLLPKLKEYEKNIEGIIKAFKLKLDELTIYTNNGITYGFSKQDKTNVFKASPVNRYGENYVYFVNENQGGADKYLIHGDKIICKYPKKAEYFNKNFDNSVDWALNQEV